MFKDKDDKWTRERGFWEVNRGDILTMVVAVGFLIIFIGSLLYLYGPWRILPPIPGLTAPAVQEPAPPPGPSYDQKFHYSLPGEAEVLIFPGKPVILPPPAPQKPENPAPKP